MPLLFLPCQTHFFTVKKTLQILCLKKLSRAFPYFRASPEKLFARKKKDALGHKKYFFPSRLFFYQFSENSLFIFFKRLNISRTFPFLVSSSSISLPPPSCPPTNKNIKPTISLILNVKPHLPPPRLLRPGPFRVARRCVVQYGRVGVVQQEELLKGGREGGLDGRGDAPLVGK